MLFLNVNESMRRINYHPKMKAISDLDLEAETRNFASAVMLDIFSHSETGAELPFRLSGSSLSDTLGLRLKLRAHHLVAKKCQEG